jgi:hypothetical protein
MELKVAIFVPAVEILGSVFLSVSLIFAVLSFPAINFTQALPISWQSTGQNAPVGTITVMTKIRADHVWT